VRAPVENCWPEPQIPLELALWADILGYDFPGTAI
jgi:hypothetical protein